MIRHLFAYVERAGFGMALALAASASPMMATPFISSFTASQSNVAPGAVTTLVWSVTGASSLSIDNGVGDVTGLASKAVAVPSTTTFTLTASDGSGASVSKAVTVAVGLFTVTGSMQSVRDLATSTLLPNGKVLIAGGYNGASYLSSTEIYDPATGVFTAGPSMSSARGAHTATLLPDGRVFLAGGYSGSAYLKSTEVYDPILGTFSAGPEMTCPRYQFTATLLADGKVLIGGGYGGSAAQSSCEVFNPVDGHLVSTGNLSSPRRQQTATILTDGRVLVAGGFNTSASSPLNSLEIYDPSMGTWTTCSGVMTSGRRAFTATLLPNGKVLLAAGYSGSAFLNTADLFDPSNGQVQATGNLLAPRDYQSATLLPSGEVLFASYATPRAELYEPATGTFTAIAPPAAARSQHTATLLADGTVLLAGGLSSTTYLNSAEIFNPHAPSATGLVPSNSIIGPLMANAGDQHLAAYLPRFMGSEFCWTATNGSLNSGQGTYAIGFSAGASGTTTLSCLTTNLFGIPAFGVFTTSLVSPAAITSGLLESFPQNSSEDRCPPFEHPSPIGFENTFFSSDATPQPIPAGTYVIGIETVSFTVREGVALPIPVEGFAFLNSLDGSSISPVSISAGNAPSTLPYAGFYYPGDGSLMTVYSATVVLTSPTILVVRTWGRGGQTIARVFIASYHS